MAIRSNGGYNSPEMAAVAQNIANMFGPPSGSDLAAYSTARKNNQQSDIVAQLRANPEYAGFDHQGILAGLFTPNQSFRAVEMDDATKRYGYDTQATTSRLNNSDTNRTSLISNMFSPLSEGQVRPTLPGDIAASFDLPELPQVAGMPKPRTQQEVLGGQTQRLIDDGQLTDQNLLSIAMGSTPVENIVGPDGRPVIQYRDQAVGAEPFFNAGAEAKPTNGTGLLPDGTQVPAVQGPDGKWRHAQTGEELPPDARVFAMSQATGTAEEIGMGPTTANTTTANNRRAEVTRTLGTLDLYEALLTDNPGSVGLPGLIRGTAQNAVAVAQDMANSFGKSAPDVEDFAADIRNGLRNVAPELFDESIPEANFYQGTLAYALARTENPSGEVSRQAFERALERVQGGFLQNTASAKAAVGAFRKTLEQELNAIKALDDPTTARTDTAFRNPNAGSDVVPQPQTQEEFDALPSGATYIDPDDGQQYRKP